MSLTEAKLASTPEPPYFAVIFTSVRDVSTSDSGNSGDDGYTVTAARMLELAAQQPGFLGVESAREELGITVSYWADKSSIQQWKQQVEHLHAQKMGRD